MCNAYLSSSIAYKKKINLVNFSTNKDKKHIDASVKERPQTPLVPSEEICKPVLCNQLI